MRVGIDLVAVASVEESVRRHGDRYLTRVFTDGELRTCRDAGGVDARRLAARFAAKEATLKVLRPGDDAVAWRSIEVRSDPAGWVEIRLSGRAAELATEAAVGELAVSLTHEDGYAAAVVIAGTGETKWT